MPQDNFSTPEYVSLEKVINLNAPLTAAKPEDLENLYELQRCAEWIISNKFQKVRLIFITVIKTNKSLIRFVYNFRINCLWIQPK